MEYVINKPMTATEYLESVTKNLNKMVQSMADANALPYSKEKLVLPSTNVVNGFKDNDLNKQIVELVSSFDKVDRNLSISDADAQIVGLELKENSEPFPYFANIKQPNGEYSLQVKYNYLLDHFTENSIVGAFNKIHQKNSDNKQVDDIIKTVSQSIIDSSVNYDTGLSEKDKTLENRNNFKNTQNVNNKEFQVASQLLQDYFSTYNNDQKIVFNSLRLYYTSQLIEEKLPDKTDVKVLNNAIKNLAKNNKFLSTAFDANAFAVRTVERGFMLPSSELVEAPEMAKIENIRNCNQQKEIELERTKEMEKKRTPRSFSFTPERNL